MLFSFTKTVIHGENIGVQTGFPTINFDPEGVNIDFGVYICKILYQDITYYGLLHYGPKKTFNNTLSLEVHILDFNKKIYNKTVKIDVIKKIRKIKKFKDIEALSRQIKQDKTVLLKNRILNIES